MRDERGAGERRGRRSGAGPRRRGRPAAVLALAVVAALAAGCEFSADTSTARPPRPGSGAPAPGGDATPGGSSASPGSGEGGAAGGSARPAATSMAQGDLRWAPVTPDPALLAAAEAACRGRRSQPGVDEIGDRPVVVADARGESIVVLVFADAASATGCIVDRADADPRASFFPVDEGPKAALEAGGITLGSYWIEEQPFARTIVVGRVGDGARWVRAHFDDDTWVQATLHDGWYAAWWRGTVSPGVIVPVDSRNIAMGGISPRPGASATP